MKTGKTIIPQNSKAKNQKRENEKFLLTTKKQRKKWRKISPRKK